MHELVWTKRGKGFNVKYGDNCWGIGDSLNAAIGSLIRGHGPELGFQVICDTDDPETAQFRISNRPPKRRKRSKKVKLGR